MQSSEFVYGLKPIVQKFVRTRVVEFGRDAIPVCGLYGDERDSTYTDLSGELMNLINFTVNSEYRKYELRRDAKLFLNKPN